ncbi:unnamed protein product [Thelazia callipaeda]|uniref:Uncharacterized protein n=1 Tax=Thelazia callipaeda TaxID=103827 RepID=A0A0N5CYH9_THECL|nr:unnamed protein product [Thelazia callipaeda]
MIVLKHGGRQKSGRTGPSELSSSSDIIKCKVIGSETSSPTVSMRSEFLCSFEKK